MAEPFTADGFDPVLLLERIDEWADQYMESNDPGFASVGRDLLYEVVRHWQAASAEIDDLRTRLAATQAHAEAMRQAGWEWKGIVDDLAHVVATHHTAVQSLIDRARVAADTPKETT